MNVIGGILKGKNIPFNNKRFNNAECTPQIIKGALFSSLGEDLQGKSLLDLYACSGQIGIEALSRNAKLVVFNEIDLKRFRFTQSLINEWGLNKRSIIFHFHALRCLRYLDHNNFLFDYIFIDPPYEKQSREVKIYKEILEELGKRFVLNRDGVIIIQHYYRNHFQRQIGGFSLISTKRYANNSLSYFKRVT
ncbi:MAG: RsmD family RNA methyltransferase [Spirochaetota bacterium]|nr:RsmD family RNA methyltransferase [Spirochaetota bacterium]